MSYKPYINKKSGQILDLSQIKPQIDGFDGDIYDSNLKIDVFDPYFYQVMITRFYFYAFEHLSEHKYFKNNYIKLAYYHNFYDKSNFQQKSQELFSMIIMPDKNDPRYKEALIRVFLLIIFETNYNYMPDVEYGVIRREANQNIRNTFLYYFLEKSQYKNDFKNLIKDDDLANFELPFNDITYLFPLNISIMFVDKILISIPYQPCGLCEQYNSNVGTSMKYDGMPAIYNDNQIVKVKVENVLTRMLNQNFRDYKSSFPLFIFHKTFFSNFWTLLRRKTQIHQFVINKIIYSPTSDIKNNSWQESCDYIKYIIANKKYLRNSFILDLKDCFENINYYSQNLEGKIIKEIINKKHIYTLIGYLLYRDNIKETRYTITSLISSFCAKDLKKFIIILIAIMKSNYFASFDKSLEILLEYATNMINKMSPRDCNIIYRSILNEFNKSIPSCNSKQQKLLLNLCNALNQKVLSIFYKYR
jgi:hypothetical protein